MAANVTFGTKAVPGASYTVPVSILGDTSYPAGGYVFTPATFGFNVLRNITGVYFNTIAGASGYELAVVPTFNSDGVTLASVALRFIVSSTGVEVATGASVATVGVHLDASGN
jgi:hypothetical protein